MNVSRTTLIALLAIAGCVGAYAQQPAEPAAAAKAEGCPKDAVAPHNHGAEKGTGPAAKKPCQSASAAVKTAKAAEPADAASSAKAIKGHDHAKIHKNQ